MAALLVTLTGGTTEALGQHHQLSLEVTPVHGTLGYGWAAGDNRLVGLELGFGFPQIDRTLAPADESLTDFLHVAGFVRTSPASPITVDGRVQLGIAGLHGCSGCLPGALAAVSGGAFLGGRRVKAGARVTGGVIGEFGHPATFVLNLTPFALLLTYAW